MSEEEWPATPTYYDPIPDHRVRLVNDAGQGFALGLAGGGAFNLLRGALGCGDGGGGLAGAARAVSAGAPRAAGTLAAYFAVCSAVDSALSLARGKDDHWNGLAAGAASWAALGLRLGAPGAALLGLFWCFEIVEDRISGWVAEPEAAPQPRRTWATPAPAPAGCFWAVPQGLPIVVKEVSAAGLGL